MARRNDGRIEPGQKLSTAISARAWNRAQDAADIVLNQRTGFGAQAGRGFTQSLVVPASVTTSIQNVGIGHVVRINGYAGRTPDLIEDETFAPEFACLSASVHVPVAFNALTVEFRNIYRLAFGVIVGGAKMPTPAASSVVNVCISGLCFARVRGRVESISSGAFVQPSMLRLQSDTVQSLTGVFDQTDAGIARLIEFSEDRVFESQQTRVFWGLVIL